jgi:Fic family protein
MCSENAVFLTRFADMLTKLTYTKNMLEKGDISNSSGWQATRPYNALPNLPPPIDLESKAILKASITGRSTLAALDQAAHLIPNPSVLINTIPLLEAQASSEIENIVTTTDAMFRYAQLEEQAVDPATKEALRYRTALSEGTRAIRERPLGVATAELICSRIKGIDMQIRRVPGIALAHAEKGAVIYTPPEGETLLRDKLSNWQYFLHEAEHVDPIVRMAVLHYQFEAIHPFSDGNGRTGRILNLLILVEKGLLSAPILYLSRYIIRHKADYYRLLQAVTAHAQWEPWILFMLAAVTETAQWTTHKIHAIRKLQELTQAYVQKAAPKIYSRELLDVIFTQPYCRIQNVVDAQLGTRQTASIYLKELVSIGVLSELKVGREKLFLHPKLVKLLTSDDSSIVPYG